MSALELVAIAVLLGQGGCGRLDFDLRANDDATEPGPDAACLGTGTFTDIAPVSAINDATTQFGSFLSPDGLTLLWDQSDGTHERLYMTVRATRTAAFPAGARIPGTFPQANQGDASLTGDGLELYFDSDESGGSCLYRATRATTAAPFDPPVALVALCATDATAGAQISADGLTLVYNSALDAAAEGDLYLTARADRGTEFPTGKKLMGLPTSIGYPALSADRLRLWFEQELTGGALKIVSAARISPSDVFSQLHDITELDTDGTEGDVSFTLDEAQVAFASQRDGSYDVFTASRPCL